jgi:adenylate cyclase
MTTAAPERRQVAVYYAELRNFTRLSEMLQPDKVLALANEFFSLVAMAITANRGKILSVQNDALLAVYAGPDRKDFSERALKSAQDVQREFGAISERWKAEYGLAAAVASALHFGEAVFGMAGPIGAQQFVAFGDCISVGERLVHRARSGEVVISLDLMKALGASVQQLQAQELPALEIPKRTPLAIYGIALETRLDFTSGKPS